MDKTIGSSRTLGVLDGEREVTKELPDQLPEAMVSAGSTQ